MPETLLARTTLLDALEDLRTGIGLHGLSIELTAFREDYPEARGREAADLLCRLLGQALGIDGGPAHRAYSATGRVAALQTTYTHNGPGLRVQVDVRYEEGGADAQLAVD